MSYFEVRKNVPKSRCFPFQPSYHICSGIIPASTVNKARSTSPHKYIIIHVFSEMQFSNPLYWTLNNTTTRSRITLASQERGWCLFICCTLTQPFTANTVQLPYLNPATSARAWGCLFWMFNFSSAENNILALRFWIPEIHKKSKSSNALYLVQGEVQSQWPISSRESSHLRRLVSVIWEIYRLHTRPQLLEVYVTCLGLSMECKQHHENHGSRHYSSAHAMIEVN